MPLLEEPQDQDDPSEVVCAVEDEQLQSLPICATDIKTVTAKDPVLSQAYNFTIRGWPKTSQSVDNKLKPFSVNVSNFLPAMDVYSGAYESLSSNHIKSLYCSFYMKVNPGMTRMKSLARLHVCWPSLDTDIRRVICAILCELCRIS